MVKNVCCMWNRNLKPRILQRLCIVVLFIFFIFLFFNLENVNNNERDKHKSSRI